VPADDPRRRRLAFPSSLIRHRALTATGGLTTTLWRPVASLGRGRRGTP